MQDNHLKVVPYATDHPGNDFRSTSSKRWSRVMHWGARQMKTNVSYSLTAFLQPIILLCRSAYVGAGTLTPATARFYSFLPSSICGRDRVIANAPQISSFVAWLVSVTNTCFCLALFFLPSGICGHDLKANANFLLILFCHCSCGCNERI